MPNDIKTDERLLRLLRGAAGKALSADELRQQRVSFILGNLPKDSTVTRAQVEEVLCQNAGGRAG